MGKMMYMQGYSWQHFVTEGWKQPKYQPVGGLSNPLTILLL